MAGKQSADTSHLSHDEIHKHDLHGSKRPPGKPSRGVLGQQGGVSLKNSARYPVALATVLVLTGVASFSYFRSTHPDPSGQAHGHSPTVQNQSADAQKPASQ